MGKLTVATVKNAKPGRHGDGAGLYLIVKPTGAKSWMLRVVQVGAKRRDVGLGSVNLGAKIPTEPTEIPILHRKSLTLAEAREKAAILRQAALAGLNPRMVRDAERQTVPTFKVAAEAAHAALSAGWAPKTREAFLASLAEHAYPFLGEMRVDHIEAAHLRNALEPIWLAKPEMARKVRQRINATLNFARSKGWRATEAPGKSVTIGLPKQPSGGNFAAMPYAEVPAFVAELGSKFPTAGRRALLLQILTAARPGEVRHAKWGQFDLAKREWHRPAEMMKAGKPHTVTLSTAAIDLMMKLGAEGQRPDALVVPGARGRPLSDMTLSKLMRDAKLPYTVHAFRSAFRDWAAEQMPHVPEAVAEAALAHVVPDKVVRAYLRTNFLEMRRELLEAWGHYVTGTSAAAEQAA